MNAGATEALARRTLGPAIADRLREDIVEGVLAPGEKLNERLLCDRFEVSRTPLREALGLLAAEGLVALSPHRGARVTAVTLAELEEVFPVLAALERLTGERAARLAADAEIAEIEALTARMRACWRAGERRGYFQLNQAIHARLLAAARNPTLAAQSGMLAARIRRARYHANLTAARWAAAVAEHDAIAAALAARDAPGLGQRLADHLGATLAALRLALGPGAGENGGGGAAEGDGDG